MTASTRTRSRSRSSARRPAHRASGGPNPRVVAFSVTAAIALIIGVAAGFLLMRPGPSSPSAPSSAPVVEGTPAREVAIPTAEAPGPVRVTKGIPSGFLAGPDGAVAAANAFTQTAVRFSNQAPATVQAAARAVVVPGSDPSVGFVVPTTFLTEKIGVRADTAMRVVPLGSKTASVTADQATVSVWFAVLSANQSGTETAGGNVPELSVASFFTSTVSLTYRSGDWRLVGLAVAEGPGIGTSPNNTLDAAGLTDQMRGSAPFQYLPPAGGTR